MGDDNSSKIIILIVSLAVTCGLISFIFFIFNSAKDAGNKLADDTINMATGIADSEITQYDGEEISGATLINLVKTYKNNASAKIYITVYNGVSITQYLWDDTLSNKITTPSVADMKDISNQNTYVNQTKYFLGQVVYADGTNAIVGLNFSIVP